MKYQLFALLPLLSLSLASPLIPKYEGLNLEKRSRSCEIVSSSGANCRVCADISCAARVVFNAYSYESFSCRAIGGTVSGDDGWDYNPTNNCYVWEVLTDTNCAPNLLPACTQVVTITSTLGAVVEVRTAMPEPVV